MTELTYQKKHWNTKKIMMLLLIVMLFLGVVYVANWYFSNYILAKQNVASQQAQLKDSTSNENIDEKDVAKLLEKVGKHILLPESKGPIIATVTDAEKLMSQQEFYNGVENGDKVIIFPEARKAVIYSEKRDIIVNVGPIVVNKPNEGEDSNGLEPENVETTPAKQPSDSF